VNEIERAVVKQVHVNHLSHRAKESKYKILAKGKYLVKDNSLLPTAQVIQELEKLQ
jgi:hypothetical protein